MSREKNYYAPIKNFFSIEMKKYLIEYYLDKRACKHLEGVLNNNLGVPHENETAEIFAFTSKDIDDGVIKQYINLYGANTACFMIVEKLGKHRDTAGYKYANRKRSCVLTLPLEPDHTQFGKLNFYKNEKDTIPDVILDYNTRGWQPYLLNIDKWHSLDRTGNPSLTFQLLYDDYDTALKILSNKKLLDIRHHP